MAKAKAKAKSKSKSKTKAKSKPRSSGRDALTLLKADHDQVKKAFKKFERMDHDDAAAVQAIVSQVCAALKQHAAVEEEIFYPAVREAIDEDDLMNEAVVEHASAKDLIAQLEGMSPDDPMLVATFTVLGEYVQHHVKEEESEMFREARKAKVDLEGLGEQIAARKGAA